MLIEKEPDEKELEAIVEDPPVPCHPIKMINFNYL
jgi:hypothetical protein